MTLQIDNNDRRKRGLAWKFGVIMVKEEEEEELCIY